MSKIIITLEAHDPALVFPSSAPMLLIGMLAALIEPIKKLGFTVAPAVAQHFRSHRQQHVRIEKDGIKIYDGPVMMS
jgi:hypothetical protein